MIDPKNVSLCLISKDAVYPREILINALSIPFGEVLILTGCDSPHRKQELFQKAKFDLVAYQDDDCIAPWRDLLEVADPSKMTCAMKAGHIAKYSTSKIALLGWGSVFPKAMINVLDAYRKVYGEDSVYRRETERIMTFFNYQHQVRLELPIIDLPSAFAADRLSMQPGHYEYIPVVEHRCEAIEKDGRYWKHMQWTSVTGMSEINANG